MEIRAVKAITDIKTGDSIILTGDTHKRSILKVELVKFTEKDGTEVIINKKENKFFNLGMYLQGISWVKELYVIDLI